MRSIKSFIVHSYNIFMSSVDESDKMLYIYLDERKTVKYWKNVVERNRPHGFHLQKNSWCKINGSIPIHFESYFRNWTRVDGRKEEATFSTYWQGGKTFGLVKMLDCNSRECFFCSKKTKRKRAHLICVHCRKRVHLAIGKHKYHQT